MKDFFGNVVYERPINAIIKTVKEHYLASGHCESCGRNVSLPCEIYFPQIPNLKNYICRACAERYGVLNSSQRNTLLEEIELGSDEDE